MSRLEFRAQVADARPPSAWILVTVAGSTLWITEQLRPWAMALQALAIVYSLLTRQRPGRWQTSPITLNIGMFGIVGATIALALEGQPATVSLAHFCALTQGLQLLDTRPRKSEFLLVALALFQVILAANLTDSVLFPPLLLVFLVATTWTLLVHTLRTEAIEAGDALEATRAISPHLMRMTFGASAVALLVALALFVILPRMRTSVVGAGFTSSFPMAGFSDRVELGTIGRIRQDPTVVLRVETLEGELPSREESYWRGLAFDHFDGREWSVTPISRHRQRYHIAGTPRFGSEVNGGLERGHDLLQRVIREPVQAGVVFGAGLVRRLEGPLDVLEMDANGGLYAPHQLNDRVRYQIWSQQLTRDERVSQDDRSVAPRDRLQPPRPVAPRFLQLPELDARIPELAAEVTLEADTDAERATALELWLRRNGRYTDVPPTMATASEGERPLSPVEQFVLGGLAGHCEYFASSMVVLARSLGLHARLVNGFAGGRENLFGDFLELARSDAHTWVEIHFQRAGWVRYDPTPPDLRMRAALAGSLGERLAQLYSVIELWWFQRVVDFDSADQIHALRGLWRAWREWRSSTSPPGAPSPDSRGGLDLDAWREWPWAWLTALFGLTALWLRIRRDRRDRTLGPALPAWYASALRLLARRGHPRAAAVTARDFVRDVAPRLSADAARALEALTERYLEQRFGQRRPDDAEQLLRELREALARAPRRAA